MPILNRLSSVVKFLLRCLEAQEFLVAAIDDLFDLGVILRRVFYVKIGVVEVFIAEFARDEVVVILQIPAVRFGKFRAVRGVVGFRKGLTRDV